MGFQNDTTSYEMNVSLHNEELPNRTWITAAFFKHPAVYRPADWKFHRKSCFLKYLWSYLHVGKGFRLISVKTKQLEAFTFFYLMILGHFTGICFISLMLRDFTWFYKGFSYTFWWRVTKWVQYRKNENKCFYFFCSYIYWPKSVSYMEVCS